MQQAPSGTEKEHTATRVLLIQPRFQAASIFDFHEVCKAVGARYPAPPLGLITVAALFPPHWSVRLVDCNTRPLTDADIDWADLVATSGMIAQKLDHLAVIARCQGRGKPVMVGGPSATSTPEDYAAADILVTGEAEAILSDVIAAWERGERKGRFDAAKFTADVTKSPIPRFDLLNFRDYLYIGVQFSRGCPFLCEFCDIIELFGRTPRTKTGDQILAELGRLYELGYRGEIDFVDDNFIGNKKAIKLFLPHLIRWQEAHGIPFTFHTEASINLSDDPELLAMMRQANFFGVFVGIESSDAATLGAMQKKQNTRRDLVQSIHRIQTAGLYVNAGFILGFDGERGDVASTLISFVKEAGIPVSIVGLLYALPNTQLTRRLTAEGRLDTETYTRDAEHGDQCTAGLNFQTDRPRRDILLDFVTVLETIYAPKVFFERVRELGLRMGPARRLPSRFFVSAERELRLVSGILGGLSRMRPRCALQVWWTLAITLIRNPGAIRSVVMLMSYYLHLGPFAQYVVQRIHQQIEMIDA